MVCKLLTDHIVKLLSGLGGQANKKLVQFSRNIHQLRVEEGGGERNGGPGDPLQLRLFYQARIKDYILNE